MFGSTWAGWQGGLVQQATTLVKRPATIDRVFFRPTKKCCYFWWLWLRGPFRRSGFLGPFTCADFVTAQKEYRAQQAVNFPGIHGRKKEWGKQKQVNKEREGCHRNKPLWGLRCLWTQKSKQALALGTLEAEHLLAVKPLVESAILLVPDGLGQPGQPTSSHPKRSTPAPFKRHFPVFGLSRFIHLELFPLRGLHPPPQWPLAGQSTCTRLRVTMAQLSCWIGSGAYDWPLDKRVSL